ncbi:hypothetical protein HID58_060032, partial [Brassica napus]
MIPRSLWTCVKYAILHHNNTPRKKTWEGSKENMLHKILVYVVETLPKAKQVVEFTDKIQQQASSNLADLENAGPNSRLRCQINNLIYD